MTDKICLQLASKSPRRRELLAQIGVPFQCVDVEVPEVQEADESALDYVLRLSKDKAQAGAIAAPGLPTLGADTIVLFESRALEKPRDLEHAIDMLIAMSGKQHSVISAVTITDGQQTLTDHSETKVTFRDLREGEIERYWATGEPQDKAGAYGIQGLGAVFVSALAGSYTGVVGLPLEQLFPMLSKFNIPYWRSV